MKDLNRHMWTNHPETARAQKIPKDMKICPNCGQKSRSDNLKRHMKTCEKKKSKN